MLAPSYHPFFSPCSLMPVKDVTESVSKYYFFFTECCRCHNITLCMFNLWVIKVTLPRHMAVNYFFLFFGRDGELLNYVLIRLSIFYSNTDSVWDEFKTRHLGSLPLKTLSQFPLFLFFLNIQCTRLFNCCHFVPNFSKSNLKLIDSAITSARHLKLTNRLIQKNINPTDLGLQGLKSWNSNA